MPPPTSYISELKQLEVKYDDTPVQQDKMLMYTSPQTRYKNDNLDEIIQPASCNLRLWKIDLYRF